MTTRCFHGQALRSVYAASTVNNASLLRRVLQCIAQEDIPGTTDLWPPITRRIASRETSRRLASGNGRQCRRAI